MSDGASFHNQEMMVNLDWEYGPKPPKMVILWFPWLHVVDIQVFF